MRSVFDFIVKPVEGRYDNEIKVGNKKLMLNSSIEDFKFISRKAEVVSVPIAFNSSKYELIELIKKRSIVYAKAMYKINCENLTKNQIAKNILKIYEAH